MIIGHEKMPSCLAPCFAFREVRDVNMCGNHHVACSVCDYGIGVSCCVVQELFHFFHCIFGWICLLGRDGSKGCEHSESTALA